MQKTQGPFNKNRIFWYLVIASSSSTPSSGLCSASSALFSAVLCLFKNAENARTIRPKSSQASGWHAKTANMRFLLYFTMKTGLRPQKPQLFNGFREAPKRPPGGPQEAYKRAPCGHTSKRPPRGPQEASKRPPRGPKEAPRRPPGGPKQAPKRPIHQPGTAECAERLE